MATILHLHTPTSIRTTTLLITTIDASGSSNVWVSTPKSSYAVADPLPFPSSPAWKSRRAAMVEHAVGKTRIFHRTLGLCDSIIRPVYGNDQGIARAFFAIFQHKLRSLLARPAINTTSLSFPSLTRNAIPVKIITIAIRQTWNRYISTTPLSISWLFCYLTTATPIWRACLVAEPGECQIVISTII